MDSEHEEKSGAGLIKTIVFMVGLFYCLVWLGSLESNFLGLNDLIYPKGQDLESSFETAKELYREDKLKLATEHLDHTLSFKQDHAPSYFLLGMISKRKSENGKAIAAYSKAIEYNEGYSAAHYFKGTLLMEMKEEKKAIRSYTNAIEYNQDWEKDYEYEDSYYQLVSALQARGEWYYRNDKCELGVDDLLRASKLKPGYSDAVFYAAACLKDVKRFEEAEKFYTTLVELTPEDTAVYNNRALLYMDTEQYDKAEQDLKSIIRIKPNVSLYHYNLGVLQDEVKKYDEAIASYTKAIELDHDWGVFKNRDGIAFSYHNRAYVNKKLKNYKEALLDFLKANELSPNDAMTNDNIGDTYYDMGQNAKAIPYYKTALKLYEVEEDDKRAAAIRKRLSTLNIAH